MMQSQASIVCPSTAYPTQVQRWEGCQASGEMWHALLLGSTRLSALSQQWCYSSDVCISGCTPMNVRRMYCWWRWTWSGSTSRNDGTPSNHWTKGEDDVEGDGELGRVHCRLCTGLGCPGMSVWTLASACVFKAVSALFNILGIPRPCCAVYSRCTALSIEGASFYTAGIS